LYLRRLEDTFRPERIDDMVRGLDDDILADEMERREIEGTRTTRRRWRS